MRCLTLIALAAALHAAGPAVAHEYRLGKLEIDHPWAPPSIGAQTAGVVYLTVRNDGDVVDRLLRIEGWVARQIIMHTTTVDSAGVARMRRVVSLDIPPHGEATLAPGGAHAMLVGLVQPLKDGGRFPVTLVFERAGSIPVEVEVEGGVDRAGAHQHQHGS